MVPTELQGDAPSIDSYGDDNTEMGYDSTEEPYLEFQTLVNLEKAGEVSFSGTLLEEFQSSDSFSVDCLHLDGDNCHYDCQAFASDSSSCLNASNLYNSEERDSPCSVTVFETDMFSDSYSDEDTSTLEESLLVPTTTKSHYQYSEDKCSFEDIVSRETQTLSVDSTCFTTIEKDSLDMLKNRLQLLEETNEALAAELTYYRQENTCLKQLLCHPTLRESQPGYEDTYDIPGAESEEDSSSNVQQRNKRRRCMAGGLQDWNRNLFADTVDKKFSYLDDKSLIEALNFSDVKKVVEANCNGRCGRHDSIVASNPEAFFNFMKDLTEPLMKADPRRTVTVTMFIFALAMGLVFPKPNEIEKNESERLEIFQQNLLQEMERMKFSSLDTSVFSEMLFNPTGILKNYKDICTDSESFMPNKTRPEHDVCASCATVSKNMLLKQETSCCCVEQSFWDFSNVDLNFVNTNYSCER